MDIKRSGSQPSKKGPEDYFTGVVRVDAPFSGSGNLSGATVTFEPGARTAWHTHPLGQTLLVTAGLGRVQRQGGLVEEIRPVTSSGSSRARNTGMAPHLLAR
jgi:quercetin dioxygenase-like cupin family protein